MLKFALAVTAALLGLASINRVFEHGASVGGVLLAVAACGFSVVALRMRST
jgi:hypothetical protein